MGQTQYRAPFSVGEVVRDAFIKGRTSPRSEALSKGDPVSLSVVREVYVKCKAGDESYGGEEGLKWSRRILKQAGLLKNKTEGPIELPQAIDLQLGPSIFAAITPLSIEKVSSLMIQEEVVSCCVPLPGIDGTVVFFPGPSNVNTDPMSKCSGTVFHKASLSDAVLVDENRDRLKAIVKAAGTATSKFTCFRVGDPEVLSCGDQFEDFFLLQLDEVLTTSPFVKVDKGLGIVFGWGVICTENGEPYFDTQGDHAPDDSMLEASADFMSGDRIAGDYHQKGPDGEIISKGKVVFAWPMTKDIADAFGFSNTRTGLMVGYKPDDPAILTKFENGEYTGFSIGGSRIPEHTEEVS